MTEHLDARMDPYEVLGIQPRASAVLATEVYWRKVAAIHDVEREDPAGAAARLERLNQALALVLDPERRAAYDREHARHDAPARRAHWRGAAPWLLPAAPAALALGVGGAAGLTPTVTVGGGLALALLTGVAVGVARRRSPGVDPFAALGLRPGSTRQEVDLAYQVLAQQWLLRLREDDRAPQRLEALGEAHRQASRIAIPAPSRPTSEKVAEPAPLVPGDASPAPVPLAVTAVSAGDAAPETPPRRAMLVLSSAAGERRVPLGSKPTRIGSSDSCDIVLRQPGVSAEHAMTWQRDGLVVLHAIERTGCLVNGHPMSWATLEDGDEVRLGAASLLVRIQERSLA